MTAIFGQFPANFKFSGAMATNNCAYFALLKSAAPNDKTIMLTCSKQLSDSNSNLQQGTK